MTISTMHFPSITQSWHRKCSREGARTVRDERSGYSVNRFEVVGEPQVEWRKEQEQNLHSYFMKEKFTLLVHHLPPSRGSVLHPRGSVELTTTPAPFGSLTFLSFFFPLSISIHPSVLPTREHQQCFFPGLHQRCPDGEWSAGQRKPTLLSRIHAYCQGELINGTGGSCPGTDCHIRERPDIPLPHLHRATEEYALAHLTPLFPFF